MFGQPRDGFGITDMGGCCRAESKNRMTTARCVLAALALRNGVESHAPSIAIELLRYVVVYRHTGYPSCRLQRGDDSV